MAPQPKRRFFLNLLLACSALCLSAANMAAPAPPPQQAATKTYDLCARVEGTDEANPSLQTLRIKLTLSGPEIVLDVRKLLQARLIAKKLEAKAGPVTVSLEDYDPKTCAASGDRLAEISVSLTPEEADSINSSAVRGAEAPLPGAEAINARAKLAIKPATVSDQAKQFTIKVY